MILFNNKYSPLTDTIYFIKSDFAVLINAFLTWQMKLEINENRTIKHISLDADFEHNLEYLLPINVVEIRRFLFQNTNSEWVAMISNTILGTDGSGPMYMSELLQCEIVGVTNSEKATILDYRNNSIRNEDELFRVISAEKDSKWKFIEEGTPFDFEDTENYTNKRRIKDEFNSQLLFSYLHELGIEYDNMDFYNNVDDQKAVLVFKEGGMYLNDKNFSLEQAQNYYE